MSFASPVRAMRVRKSVLLLVAVLVVSNVAAAAVHASQPFVLPLDVDLSAVDWSPDGAVALLAGEGGTVLRYDGARLERVPQGVTTATLRDVAWGPDGRYALLVGDGATILLYDARNDGAIAAAGLDREGQRALGGITLAAVTWVSADTVLIAGSEGTVLRYRLGGAVEPFLSGCTLAGPLCPNFQGIAWRPGGDHALAVGDRGTIVREPGTRSGTTYRCLTASGDAVRCAAEGGPTYWDVGWARPGGEAALVVGDRGTLKRWDGNVLTSIPSATGVDLRAVAWRPYTSVALIAGAGGLLLEFNDLTGRIAPVPAATAQDLDDLAWHSRRESALLIGGGTLRVFPNLGIDPLWVAYAWFAEGFALVGAAGVWGYGYYRHLQRMRRRIPAEQGFAAVPVLDFEAKHLLYQVLLRNRSTVTVSEVTVRPKVSRGNFAISEPEKVVPLLRPRASGTTTFILRSRGRPEELEVSAEVAYYDGEQDLYRTILIPAIALDLTLPPLRAEPLEKEEWEEVVSRYFSVEEHLKLYIPAEEAFQEAIDAIRGKDLAVIETTTARGKDTFSAAASLFARDGKGRGYAVQVASRSAGISRVSCNLTIRVFAEVEETLFGFYHLIFGDMESRLRRRDESLDIMKRITELTMAIREREEAPEAAVEITKLRGNLDAAFESLRTRLEREAEVRSVEELNEVYRDLAQGLMADGTIDADVGRRRIREALPEAVYAELELVPEAISLLSEAEASDALRMAELLPESGRKALLLVYPNALEVYLRERLRMLLPRGVTVLLGAEFGHINTRRKDWLQRWKMLSLGSCIHVMDNNQYLFLRDVERWEKVTKGMLHELRDMRNVIAHPSERNPAPGVVRQRVYEVLAEMPRVLKPSPPRR